MPKATVVEIDLNAVHTNGKSYVKFVTQGDPYKGRAKDPRTHMLWPAFAGELIEIVKTLKVGDRVDYGVNDTQYKNMISLKKDTGEAPVAKGGGGYTPNPDVQKSISRAASMKEATQIVLFKAKKTDNVLEDIIRVTQYLEKFLLFNPQFDVDKETTAGDDEIPF